MNRCFMVLSLALTVAVLVVPVRSETPAQPAAEASPGQKQNDDLKNKAVSGLDAVIEKAKQDEIRENAKKEAEERKARVLVDDPDKLLPLSRGEKVWVTPDKKSVVAIGKVCLRKGMLEFFACVAGTKEHESIIALEVKPYLIHAGLLVTGAEPGGPAKFDPEFVPPSGTEIAVSVRWKDKDGKIREIDARQWVLESRSKKTMETHWVFTGSMLRKTDDDQTVYMADATGELIGLSNFPASIMDVPIESSDENDQLLFAPNTEQIPDVGTPVTLLLSPVKKDVK